MRPVIDLPAADPHTDAVSVQLEVLQAGFHYPYRTDHAIVQERAAEVDVGVLTDVHESQGHIVAQAGAGAVDHAEIGMANALLNP